VAIVDWELNLFHSDPTLLQRSPEESYERATALFSMLADPRRLILLHALIVGENTAQRAALWADLPQGDAGRELNAMIVQLHIALAHGRERLGERHPRLLAKRRAARRAG